MVTLVGAGSDEAPQKLGRYVLHSLIATGGMAEVWLARQEGPAGFQKFLVAKKILPQLAGDQRFIQMFLNEARLAAQLNHSNVAQIFELGEADGSYFLVMEYIHGLNLRGIRTRLARRGLCVPPGILASVVASACEGLHYAHELKSPSGEPLQLVHRDVSPENILVSFEGQVKVVDFGIAKAASLASHTAIGQLKGKFPYMSPEQVDGEVLDRRADVYAMGAVMYELLADRRLFQHKRELDLLRAIREEQPRPLREVNPDVPEALAQIVERALVKERERRTPDARTLGRELQAFLHTLPAPVGMAEVASFMAAHFAGEKEAQASAIATPSSGPSENEPSQAPTRSERPTPAREDFNEPTAPSARGRPRRTATLAGAVVVAVGAGLGFWALRDPGAGPAAIAAHEPELPAPVALAGPDASIPADVAAAAPPAVPAPAKPIPVATVPAPPVPARAGPGRIVLRVLPWAEVSLDGKSLGITPLPPVTASAGKHLLRFTNPKLGKTRDVPVTVRAGRDEVVRVDLLE